MTKATTVATQAMKTAKKYVPLQNFNPLGFVQEVVSLHKEILRHRTECKRIDAETQVRLAEINARKDMFMQYIDQSFAERRAVFQGLFDCVHAAMDRNDNEKLAMALHGITELARQTPFRDFMDMNRTRQLLAQPGHEWEF